MTASAKRCRATGTHDGGIRKSRRAPRCVVCTVSYQANGADGGTALDDQTKTEGEDVTLAANSGNLTRDGYICAG
ncbi:MAG: hypothetical protein GVY29_03430 [Spirochaetes bacterium]|nr:hypothetical protein [Spirochaetota bacterium]